MPHDIYVPRDPALIDGGAGIVGTPASEWMHDMHPALHENRLVIDYEARGPSVNIKTFADRCYHAADRQQSHYATHKRMWIRRDALIPAGRYWMKWDRVEVRNAGELNALRKWLFPDLSPQEGFDALDPELRGTRQTFARPSAHPRGWSPVGRDA